MPYTEEIRIAAILHSWDEYFQRILRGAFQSLESHVNLRIKHFPVTKIQGVGFSGAAAISAAKAWQPHGILTGLMGGELEELWASFSPLPPVVNVLTTAARPGMSLVTGSMASRISLAAHHLRQVGIRSPSILFTDSHETESSLQNTIREAGLDQLGDQSLCLLPLDDDMIMREQVILPSIPIRLVSLLLRSSKPSGIICLQTGVGGFVMRVCRELGLRVPEDIAVIGVDSPELCLSCDPPLTSVHPVPERVGLEAISVLYRIMKRGENVPAHTRIPDVEIAIRASTGRVAGTCDIAAALEYIKRNACSGIGVEDVIRETQGASRTTFYREFQRLTGKDPGDVIRARRTEESLRLLEGTNYSMSLIADMCGFSNNSAFARTFKAQYGCSPMEFRERHSDNRQREAPAIRDVASVTPESLEEQRSVS